MRRAQRWQVLGAVILATGLVLPAPARADRGGGEHKESEHGDDDHHHKEKGGVCSRIPQGCRQDDCRCDDGQTCVQCRQFVCRREKKRTPSVVCSPCCQKKGGTVRCRPAPDDDDRKCVPSPS